MAALCITSSTRCCCLSFIWWKQKQKIGSFQKKWQQCPPFLSFLFNVLAAGFLCFSSPVPASHYKYDEQNPPFPSLPSPPFDRTSPLLLLLSSHRLQVQKLSLSSWTTHKRGSNQILLTVSFALTDISQDILVSLLRTEGVLPGEEVEEEENIHHNFALVERWREVSKVIRGIICQHLGIPKAEPKSTSKICFIHNIRL